MNVPITITVGERTVHTRRDRSGYIDIRSGATAWSRAGTRRSSIGGRRRGGQGGDPRHRARGDLRAHQRHRRHRHHHVAAAPAHRGLEHLREHESARHVVPGMATMYRELLRSTRTPRSSTSPPGRGTPHRHLNRFLKRHGYPLGPLLLDRLGPDQHRLVPLGAGAQARVPPPAGQRVPEHPVGSRRGRRPARPQDLRRLRRGPTGPRRGHRDPRADARPSRS